MCLPIDDNDTEEKSSRKDESVFMRINDIFLILDNDREI